MNPTVHIAMIGWIPFALFLFTKLEPRRAVIAIFALGWMFLPQYTYDLPGLPDYTKITAIAYSIVIGTFLFNRQAFSNYQYHIVDTPIAIWCLVPIITSVNNDLGLYDGLSASLNKTAMWGLPYYIGRIYFNDKRSLQELAFGIFLGGLIYMPLCWWEVLMSPRLHKIIYGWHAANFRQSFRGGGYRPTVFMEHGLMVAMWTLMAFLSGYQLHRSGWLNANFPRYIKHWTKLIILLLITIFLNKSTGALALLVIGILFLEIMKISKSKIPLLILIIFPIFYTSTRASGNWDGQSLLDAAGSVASEERVASLYYRLRMEDILIEKANIRPWFGWGQYRRSFVFDEDGEPISVPDGEWISAFGQYGLIGLISLGLMLTISPIIFTHIFHPRKWADGDISSLVANPLIIVLFTIDSLFNAMFNPLVIILCGGISGMLVFRKDQTYLVELSVHSFRSADLTDINLKPTRLL